MNAGLAIGLGWFTMLQGQHSREGNARNNQSDASRRRYRILQFIEQDAVDRHKLQAVLEHHGLTSKWRQFTGKYSEGIHE
jgi:hypothetical protein